MKKSRIYLLAGLGFDKRIFYNLTIQNAEINYLNWLEPDKNEPFENYISRMAAQISSPDTPIILIGHSFGGIIIQEIAKHILTSKVILISSIKSKVEMPATLKFMKKVPIYKYFNQKLILRTFPIWARLFGYNSEKGRVLFVQMISSCTDNYFKWSMDKIVHFNGTNDLDNLIHIHGTRDKTFPIKKIIDPIKIEDGSHFMVFSKADEVSEVLNREID